MAAINPVFRDNLLMLVRVLESKGETNMSNIDVELGESRAEFITAYVNQHKGDCVRCLDINIGRITLGLGPLESPKHKQNEHFD